VEATALLGASNQKPSEPGRYGWKHQQARARWAARVATGQVNCARCGRPIAPGEAWDLGHADGDPSQYAGPEHARCNRATAGRRRKRPKLRQQDEFKQDDPANHVFWGPPDPVTGYQLRWSRPWYDWRSER
jgi:hypothetical protein